MSKYRLNSRRSEVQKTPTGFGYATDFDSKIVRQIVKAVLPTLSMLYHPFYILFGINLAD